MVARAAQRLLYRASEQHHVVGGAQGIGGVKHGLDLAWAKLDFKRQQRQAQCLRGAIHDAHRFFDHVHPLF